MIEYPKSLYYKGKLKGTFQVFNSEWCMGIAKDADEEKGMLEAGFSLTMSDKPSQAVSEPSSDDLTKIKGVGDKLADKLLDAGIERYEQIAHLTPEKIETLEAMLPTQFKGRITRDDWVGQAKEMI